MRADEALVVKMRATAGVTVLVGSRIYLGSAIPQDAPKPYLVIEDDTREPQYHMTGTVSPVIKLGRIDFYAVSYNASESREIVAAVEAALSGWQGSVTDGGDTVQFRFLHIDDDTPEPIRPESGTNRPIHTQRQTYRTAYY